MRRSISLAWRDPLAVFARLSEAPSARLLYSPDRRPSASVSVIVAYPSHVLRARNGAVTIDEAPAPADPFREWAALMRARATHPIDGAPFGSGAVGFVGYEAAQYIDPAFCTGRSPGPLPEIDIGLYDAALVFDHATRVARLVERDAHAAERLRAAFEQADGDVEPRPAELRVRGPVVSDMSADAYSAAVREAVDRIHAGDFFQANLTRLLTARLSSPVRAFDLFLAMVHVDRAPMAAFMSSPSGWAASISPERLLRVEPTSGGLRIVVEPIKGTAARHANPELDRAAAEALLRSEKDRAENVMIVDLMRNDLSRVCRDGTIAVSELCGLHTYAGVHHLTSTVRGFLRADTGAVDALRALFPSGSITGAPKIEAMRFIRRIEGRGRGLYTGALGYIDDGGAADFSVTIRTAEIGRDEEGLNVLFGVGGGITALSDAVAEYDETIDKAATFVRALGARVSEMQP